jgi:hypothetical protein
MYFFRKTTATVQPSSPHEKRGSNKMKNQSKYSMKKLDGGVVPIVLTLNDTPLEVRKKSASEPTYIDHL